MTQSGSILISKAGDFMKLKKLCALLLATSLLTGCGALDYLTTSSSSTSAVTSEVSSVVSSSSTSTIVNNFDNEQTSSTYTITFNDNNGGVTTTSVNAGSSVSEPSDPTKTNYVFNYWATDSSLTTPYDFNDAVTIDTTLYAKYYLDYATVVNEITAEKIKSNVTIYTTSSGFRTSSSSQGSGVIFYETSRYYYALTNNHVTEASTGSYMTTYRVEDYEGTTYNGSLIYESSDYDLAVVAFAKSRVVDLTIAALATTDPSVEEEIIAVGQPEGQLNAITFGKVLEYSTLTLDDSTSSSNVTFDVIKHSAPLDHGSSGGALYNTNLELVGINYAGATDTDGSYLYGGAIPINKINEFLNNYFWN